jgi:hypothetical protein
MSMILCLYDLLLLHASGIVLNSVGIRSVLKGLSLVYVLVVHVLLMEGGIPSRRIGIGIGIGVSVRERRRIALGKTL